MNRTARFSGIAISKLLFILGCAWVNAGVARADGTLVSLPPASATETGFQVTQLNNMEEAMRLFSLMSPMRGDSQCFHRSYLWADQLYREEGVNTVQVFMFLTNRFRSSFYWWETMGQPTRNWLFHVALMVKVGGLEIVLDPQFFPGPVTLEAWSYAFVGAQLAATHPDSSRNYRAESRCSVITNYNQFIEANRDPENYEFCFVRKVPMFYMRPQDVRALDEGRRGGLRGEFDAAQLEDARQRAVPETTRRRRRRSVRPWPKDLTHLFTVDGD